MPSGDARRAGHVPQDIVVREQPPLAEVGVEEPPHQRVLARRAARRLGEPVGVEGAAQTHPVEVEGEAHLRPERGELRVAGPDLLGPHAVLARHGAAPAVPATRGRRVPVQLEGAVHHRDLVAVLEVAQGDMEPGQTRARTTGTRSRTTRRSACTAHPRPADARLAYTQSCAGHPSAAAMSVQQVAPSMDSRMMSACPACRAVSSMRCSRTQRGVQTIPAGYPRDQVVGGRKGCAEVLQGADDLLGHAGLLVGQGEHVLERLPFHQAEPSDQSSWGTKTAVSPVVRNVVQARSTSAACFIRPARLNSLTVGRAEACSWSRPWAA